MIKKRILVVDDDNDFCLLVKGVLEDSGGFEVETENLGAQTPERVRTFRPDLVLLDILLDDIEGGEVAQTLSEDPEMKDLPIVFLTGLLATESEIQNKGGLIGGRPFLSKPTTLDKLLEVIQANLK